MEQKARRAGRSVLIAAANSDLHQVLAEALARRGWTAVRAAADAVTAQLRARRYDLVLVDLQTHGPTGIDLIHRIRQDPDQAVARTPLMAYAPYAGMGEGALAAGADDYLVAPCVPSHMLSRMAACVEREVSR